jgi:hypothetical protein
MSLSEGDYNFDLKIYKSGNIVIPAIDSKYCSEQPKSGLLGYFGFTEQKCTDITIPSQTISNFIYAGGKLDYYLTPSELENAKVLRIYAQSAGTPTSAEDVGAIYDRVDKGKIDLQIA